MIETSGVSVNGGKTIINNSTIRSATGSSLSYGVKIIGSVVVYSSSVSGGTLALYKPGVADSFRIGTSQIRGGHNWPGGDDKIIYCFECTLPLHSVDARRSEEVFSPSEGHS